MPSAPSKVVKQVVKRKPTSPILPQKSRPIDPIQKFKFTNAIHKKVHKTDNVTFVNKATWVPHPSFRYLQKSQPSDSLKSKNGQIGQPRSGSLGVSKPDVEKREDGVILTVEIELEDQVDALPSENISLPQEDLEVIDMFTHLNLTEFFQEKRIELIETMEEYLLLNPDNLWENDLKPIKTDLETVLERAQDWQSEWKRIEKVLNL